MKNWPRRKRRIRIYRIRAPSCKWRTTGTRSCHTLFKVCGHFTRSSASAYSVTTEEHQAPSIILPSSVMTNWVERWQILTFILKNSKRKLNRSSLGKKMHHMRKRMNSKCTIQYASLTVMCTACKRYLTQSVTYLRSSRVVIKMIRRRAAKGTRNMSKIGWACIVLRQKR